MTGMKSIEKIRVEFCLGNKNQIRRILLVRILMKYNLGKDDYQFIFSFFLLSDHTSIQFWISSTEYNSQTQEIKNSTFSCAKLCLTHFSVLRIKHLETVFSSRQTPPPLKSF